EPRHARVEQLLAQIRRGVDQHRSRSAAEQQRAPPAAVLRIFRIAGAPVPCPVRAAQARHSGRGTAAQYRGDECSHERFAFAKRRKKLPVVALASSSGLISLSSASIAAVNTTKAGSLRLPRLPCGAR